MSKCLKNSNIYSYITVISKMTEEVPSNTDCEIHSESDEEVSLCFDIYSGNWVCVMGLTEFKKKVSVKEREKCVAVAQAEAEQLKKIRDDEGKIGIACYSDNHEYDCEQILNLIEKLIDIEMFDSSYLDIVEKLRDFQQRRNEYHRLIDTSCKNEYSGECKYECNCEPIANADELEFPKCCISLYDEKFVQMMDFIITIMRKHSFDDYGKSQMIYGANVSSIAPKYAKFAVVHQSHETSRFYIDMAETKIAYLKNKCKALKARISELEHV